MNWRYKCPSCRVSVFVPWADRASRFNCPTCKSLHTPPIPGQDPDAHVDARKWPLEMEQAVVAIKDGHCTVPGCQHAAETLDHRIPWSGGGRTSVRNLFPMCNADNQSKGDQEYVGWLARKRARAFVRDAYLKALTSRSPILGPLR